MTIGQQESEWYFTPLPTQHMSIIFSPTGIRNIIQIHSGETSWPRDSIAHSVTAQPHVLKHASLTFKNLQEVNL